MRTNLAHKTNIFRIVMIFILLIAFNDLDAQVVGKNIDDLVSEETVLSNLNWDEIENQSKESLQVEGWMSDANFYRNTDLHWETELEITSWMLQNNYFEGILTNEENLKVENWMTDPNYYENKEILSFKAWMFSSDYYKDVVFEPGLQVAPWMFDAYYYDVVMNEENTKIEHWMTDSQYFELDRDKVEKQLIIKAWMMDDKFWED